MKKYFLVVALAASIFTIISCEGTYVVSTRPTTALYTRPVAPGSNYVWIEGDWRYEGGRYTWHEGYWERYRAHRSYTPGRWVSKNNGWYWRRGRWH